jgi:hypothetical protein
MITISWVEPDNGGSNIDDYQVKMCVGLAADCSFSIIASTTVGATQLTLSSLTKGTNYQFKVHAHNVIGYGADSDPLAMVAADKPRTPDAPINDITITDRTQIGVNWVAPIQNVGATITNYLIWWKTQAEGDYLNSAIVDESTFSYIITPLTEGEYYDVTIQARNVVGDSVMSDPTRIVVAVSPDPPSNLQVIQQSSSSIAISWFAVTGSANGGSPVTGYTVYWKPQADTDYTITGTTTESTL